MKHLPRPPQSPALWSAAALLAGLGAVSAQAASWDQSLPDQGSRSVLVANATLSGANRWVLGSQGENTLLLRESGGVSNEVTRSIPDARLLAMPEGGVLVLETTGLRSSLRRLDGQGLPLWQREMPNVLLALADAGGALWLETVEGWQRLAADGTPRSLLLKRQQPVLERTVAETVLEQPRYQRPQRAVGADGGLFASGWSQTAGAGVAQLARYNYDGRLAWSWQDAGGAENLEFSAVGIGPADTHCAAGRARSGGKLLRRCFSAAGQVLWSSQLEAGAEASTPLIAVRADGSLYALDRLDAETARLAHDGPNAAQRWTRPLPATIADMCATTVPGCALRVDAAGNAVVIAYGARAPGGSQRLRLISYAVDGSLRFDQELPFTTISGISQDSRGHYFAVGTRVAGAWRLIELDTQGRVVADNLEMQTRNYSRVLALGAAASGDTYEAIYGQGDTYVVAAADGAESYRLRRVDGTGATRWERELPGHLDAAQLTSSVARVCVAENETRSGRPVNRIRCLDAADGSEKYLRPSTAPITFRTRDPQPASLFRLLPGERLVSSFPYDGVQFYNANGATEVRYGTDQVTPLADVNSIGGSVIVERALADYPDTDDGQMIRRTASGRVAFTLDLRTERLQPLQLVYSGQAIYVLGKETQASGDYYVWSLDESGFHNWKRRLVGASGLANIDVDGDEVMVVRRINPGTADAQLDIEILRTEDGNRIWRKTFRGDQAVLDAPARRIAALRAGDARWSLRSLALADGAETPEIVYPCGRRDCGFSQILAHAGTVRVARAEEVSARNYVQITPIRIDQPGIGGAWGPLYGEGEGLVIDWLGHARLAFAPWFTFSRAGGNDPAQLRWLVAQAGNVAPGAKVANLEIYSSANGVFDTPGDRRVTRVGTGTLQFSDCSNGQLSYRFEDTFNDCASGNVTLTRLTPATEPCELADGSIQAAAGARPPSKGFDARQSGSWYEPATGGQGLQMTVQPDGPFFGAWFTYDVPGPGNDPERQHWFTLYGNLAEAVNGRIELLVVQGIGGAFDRTPTRNRYIVGKATLQMHGCDSATLQYRFDASELAGPYAGRNGDIALLKEGGCRP